jgi:hypothetical protein
MLIFAGLMIVIATLMLRGRRMHEPDSSEKCHWQRCSLTGLGVGVLTGFLGSWADYSSFPAARLLRPSPAQIRLHHFAFRDRGDSFAGLAGHCTAHLLTGASPDSFSAPP